MTKPEAINRENLINSIWEHRGKLAVTAYKLGISVRTVYNYAKKYATVQAAIDNSRFQFDEFLCDKSELELQKAVKNGSAWAIKYSLDNKGRNRGYGNRLEIEHNIPIHIIELTDDG